MKKILFVACLSLLLTACGSNEEPVVADKETQNDNSVEEVIENSNTDMQNLVDEYNNLTTNVLENTLIVRNFFKEGLESVSVSELEEALLNIQDLNEDAQNFNAPNEVWIEKKEHLLHLTSAWNEVVATYPNLKDKPSDDDFTLWADNYDKAINATQVFTEVLGSELEGLKEDIEILEKSTAE